MRGRLVLLCASLVLCGLALEAGLRLASRSAFPRGYYRVDPRSGLLAATPHWRGYRASEFGTIPLRTNRLGFRGPLLDPGARGRRVLVIGDSFVQAVHVRDEDTAGRRLAERSGGALQVMEVGMPGWGQGDALRWLATYGGEFQPDVVVVSAYLGNDLSVDNMRPGNLGSSALDATPEGYLLVSGVKKDTGRAGPEARAQRTGALEWLRDRTTRSSLAYLFVRARIARLVAGDAAAPGRDRMFSYYERFLASHARDPALHAPYYETFFRLVDAICARGARDGYAVVVASIPWHVTLDADAFERTVRHFGLDPAAYDRALPPRRVRRGLAARGVPHVDLFEAFSAKDRPWDAYGVENPHLSPTGHRWIAESLARALGEDRLAAETLAASR